MDFEDLLLEVGEYGKFQKTMVYLFLSPACIFLPWFFMNTLFMVSVPDHWCNVPELESWNLTLEQEMHFVRPKNDPKCLTYDFNYTELFSSPTWNMASWQNWTMPENGVLKSCSNGWKYDKTNFDFTASSQWDLVCSDTHYNSLILTLVNIGSIFGTPIYGTLSDRVGRKPTFFLTVLVTFVSAVASVLMTNFTAFVVLRSINGSMMPSIFQVPFIIVLETVGPTMRTRLNGVANVSWTFGLCLLPLLAWLTRNWVLLGLVTSSVTAVFFIYWKFLPESPRWLISRERFEESAEILTRIAKINGKSHTKEEILILVKKVGNKVKEEREMNNQTHEPNVLDILTHANMRKYFCILTCYWIACGSTYYGLQINVPNLGGNEFLNFFFLAVVEIPGFIFAWYFMETFGRRWCSVVCLLGTSIILLVPVFVSDPGVVPSLIGKFGASAAFMVIYQQSSELYPTVVRALGMGLTATVHSTVTVAVPYIVYLAEYGKYIPFLVISIICMIAGTAASFLPETLNENLPQTIRDSETFAEHQKYFAFRSRRRPSCYEKRESESKEHADGMNGIELSPNPPT